MTDTFNFSMNIEVRKATKAVLRFLDDLDTCI